MRRRQPDRPTIKTAEQIEGMRRSNRLARRIVAELGTLLEPGVTTNQLDQVARRLTEEAGASAAFYQYRGFPAYICASLNDAVVHGIPNDQPLVEGDLVSIDYGCFVDGWCGDTAWTWAVGQPSEGAAHLMQVTRESLAIGIENAIAGKRVFDIAKPIQDHCESNGCGVVRSLVGHGIGSELHEPPQVPNYAHPESCRDRLRPGMTICIEPMVTAGGYGVHEADDGWTALTDDGSLAAHYEHCIVILSDGPEILSLPDDI